MYIQYRSIIHMHANHTAMPQLPTKTKIQLYLMDQLATGNHSGSNQP
jgi:hypothetical protein